MGRSWTDGMLCLCLLAALLAAAQAQEFCDGDCYDLLGLTQRATKEDIKKVYKKFSMMYHPDRKPGPEGIEKFKKIAQAYEVLIDDKMRRKYDYEIRNPSGWVSGNGGFVGQTGDVDTKVILIAIGGCLLVLAFAAVRFLNIMELIIPKQQKLKKPRKSTKSTSSSKNEKAN